jgi:hypothetical protein
VFVCFLFVCFCQKNILWWKKTMIGPDKMVFFKTKQNKTKKQCSIIYNICIEVPFFLSFFGGKKCGGEEKSAALQKSLFKISYF